MLIFVSKQETMEFRRHYPCSGLPEFLEIGFEFDHTDSLVDIIAMVDGKKADSAIFDGAGLLAMANAAQSREIGQPAIHLRKYAGKEGSAFFREMTLQEIRALQYGAHIWILSNSGDARRVKVNGSPKLWKTRPDEFELPVKYGMYEYARFSQRDAQRILVELA